MTFDLHIARCRDAQLAIGGGKEARRRPGFLGAIGLEWGFKPITDAEFHRTLVSLQEVPAIARHVGAEYRVRYPDPTDPDSPTRYPDGRGMPWFVARHDPDPEGTEGKLVLALSWTHYSFPGAMVDLFDMAFWFARALGANVFEESGCRRIRPGELDTLLDPGGAFFRSQTGVWLQSLESGATSGMSPLEYPLGGVVDSMAPYLVLHVVGGESFTEESVRALRAPPASGLELVAQSPTSVLVRDVALHRPLGVVHLLPDGRLQLRPLAWRVPFADAASATAAVARNICLQAGSRLLLFDVPLEGSLASQFDERIRGLGVEFYEWTLKLPSLRTT